MHFTMTFYGGIFKCHFTQQFPIYLMDANFLTKYIWGGPGNKEMASMQHLKGGSGKGKGARGIVHGRAASRPEGKTTTTEGKI